MTITITLTVPQASALIHAVATCLHLAHKSPITGISYGIDLGMVKHLNAAMDTIETAIPFTQTNEPCNTPQPTSSQQ